MSSLTLDPIKLDPEKGILFWTYFRALTFAIFMLHISDKAGSETALPKPLLHQDTGFKARIDEAVHKVDGTSVQLKMPEVHRTSVYPLDNELSLDSSTTTWGFIRGRNNFHRCRHVISSGNTV